MSAGIRVIAALSLMVVATGCATRRQPIYLWESFPRQQYATLLRYGGGAPEQINLLEAHAEKARGSGAALPPGFRAHLGLLHHNIGNLEQARSLWQAERQAFPESAPYMDTLIRRLNQDGNKAAKAEENPS